MTELSVKQVLAVRAMAGLAAGIVITGAAVVGCGSVSSGGAKAPGSSLAPAGQARVTSTTLCADPNAVSQLQVTRIPSISQLGPSKPGQNRIARITVTDPAKARELARAICALPMTKHGFYNCPLDTGGGYQLTFTALGRRLPRLTLQSSGCEFLTGAGHARLADSTRFWAVFEQVTGIQGIVR